MTLKAATEAVDATMRQAWLDAAEDLGRQRGVALQVAHEKSHRFISTSRSGSRSEHARYDPAARLLREWYVAVHAEALNKDLGGGGRVPGVAEVEAMAAQVRRIRVGNDSLGPLRATAYVWRVARADAATATLGALDDLRRNAPARAARYADGQVEVEVDATRAPILRHWHQRCYLDAIAGQLRLQRPLEAVTTGEVEAVAVSVRLGQFHRIIGADGIPLVTAHGTRLTDADRRLAEGKAGVVPPPLQVTERGSSNHVLRLRVVAAWNVAPQNTRMAWATAAGVAAAGSATRWAQVPGVQQSRLIAQWLDEHRGRVTTAQAADRELVYLPFSGNDEQLPGRPEEAAARMFGHDVHPTSSHHLTRASFPRTAAEATRAPETPHASGRRVRRSPEAGTELGR